MEDQIFDLKEVEKVLREQFKLCACVNFYIDFEKHKMESVDIPELLALIELMKKHEKDIVKQRQELELRILEHRMNTITPF